MIGKIAKTVESDRCKKIGMCGLNCLVSIENSNNCEFELEIIH